MTIVSQTGARAPRAYYATGRTDGARVFRAAVRHSRLVRCLRIGIPVGALVSVAAIFAVAIVLDPLRALASLPLKMDGLVISGPKITMQRPHVAGFTQDKRPYTLSARAATHDVTNPDRLELIELRADIEIKNAGNVHVSAQNGVFLTKTEMLTLSQDVVFKSATYEGRLSEATINVRSGSLVSEKPVEVKTQQGTVSANRMEMSNSGEVIKFDQGVTVVITLEKSPYQVEAAAQ